MHLEQMMLINILVNIQKKIKKIKLKTSTKPEQNNLFNGLTFVASMIGYTLMINTNKGKNTMVTLHQKSLNDIEAYNKLREEELILKAAKSSGATESEMLYGSLFVTFTPGFVNVLAQNLKEVLEKMLDNTTVKMYNTTNNEYAYDFI